MFIHFKGQDQDVMINMNEVKEIDWSLKYNESGESNKILFWGVRLVMTYPTKEVQQTDGTSNFLGMYHFDFRFQSEKELEGCKFAVAKTLNQKDHQYAHIELPEIIPSDGP